MTTPRALVIYHADCFDGFTSAWLADRYWHLTIYPRLVDYRPQPAVHTVGVEMPEFFAATYGGPAAPSVRNRDVLMVDFCYPRATIEAMAATALSLTILDHHKTAEKELRGIGNEPGEGFRVVFDMERSGCGLLWDELIVPGEGNLTGLRPARPRPAIVNYVEDRDLWRRSLPNGDAVSAWIAAMPMTFETWDRLAEEIAHGQAAEYGRQVQRYIDQYGRQARAQARFETIGGHKVPTMNVPYMNCSEHVGGLLEAFPSSPFAAGFFRRGDGRWQFSLRSKAPFDVSEIASWYGGGGHAQAAGFDVVRLPWEID
jgi:oligoribonuclease NrnB/cAMP/cGMP phosphodiesterase (DHH superfamily)